MNKNNHIKIYQWKPTHSNKGSTIKTPVEYFVYQELFAIRPFVVYSESVDHFGTMVVTVVWWTNEHLTLPYVIHVVTFFVFIVALGGSSGHLVICSF